MRMYVDDIKHPLTGETLPSAKRLYITLKEGVRPINIVLGLTYMALHPMGSEQMRGGSSMIMSADVCIGFKAALRNLSVIKNRFGSEPRGLTADYFFNIYVPQILVPSLGIDDPYDEMLITNQIFTICDELEGNYSGRSDFSKRFLKCLPKHYFINKWK